MTVAECGVGTCQWLLAVSAKCGVDATGLYDNLKTVFAFLAVINLVN